MSDILILFEQVKPPSSRNYLGFISALKRYTPPTSTVRYYGAALPDLGFLISTAATAITLPGGRDIASFAFVYFKSWHRDHEAAHACAVYLHDRGVPFADSEILNQRSYSKLSEMLLLVRAGLPVPDTLISRDEPTITAFMQHRGMKAVVKNAAEQKGRDNHLCHSPHEVVELVKTPDKRYLIQEYIPNEGDYRFAVYGDRVAYVLHRHSQSGGHVHNFHRAAKRPMCRCGVFRPIRGRSPSRPPRCCSAKSPASISYCTNTPAGRTCSRSTIAPRF